jgi:hypothetical protein
MTRVEWTRLDGADVEAVVAMFVNREHVNSVRITPSRGDGGVDILDRQAGPHGGDAVYQVKRYTGALTARQKAEVEKSLQALASDPRWSGLNVTAWHLVTPWDPTPEAETWLQGLTSGYSFTPVWHGLGHVEQLAARYQDIVDYYLHGGRSRIDEAYKAVAALFGVDRADENLDVPGIAERIRKALPTLDADPHYRYELHFGEGPLPGMSSRPGLVMTWIAGDANGGRWTAVDIIARCAASVQERPITVTGQFVTERGSEFEATFRDFISYGTPFTSPEGTYQEVEVTAPGGLGGHLDRATVVLFPAADEADDNPHLHLEVLAPDGTVLAAADVDRTGRSRGEDGLRVVLQEAHRVFTIEDRYNLSGMTITRTMRLGDLTGQPVSAVRPALEFIRHCRPPNTGRTSVRYTPPELGTTDPTLGFNWSEEATRTLTSLFDAVGSLAVIQRHTSAVIRVPDLAALPPGQAKDWFIAAKILRGEEVTMAYPEGHCIIVVLDTGIAPPGGEFGITTPMGVAVGEQRVDLGMTEVWLSNATLVERRHHEGRMHYAFTTPGRTVRYRRAAESLST